MKITKFILGLTFVFIAFSCNSEKESTSITLNEANANARLDVMTNDISNIIETQEERTFMDLSEISSPIFSSCANISRVPAIGTIDFTTNHYSKVIDFGTSCTLNTGCTLSGKIKINYNYYDDQNTTRVINYSFDGFKYNGISIDDSSFGTVTRTMTEVTDSAPVTHPLYTMAINLTATFPDGSAYTRTGTLIREFTAGYDTKEILTDNTYLVTGSWTTTFPNTENLNSVITKPLKVRMNCTLINKPVIVFGVIKYERSRNSASLDFGTITECDNLAIYTFDGYQYKVTF